MLLFNQKKGGILFHNLTIWELCTLAFQSKEKGSIYLTYVLLRLSCQEKSYHMEPHLFSLVIYYSFEKVLWSHRLPQFSDFSVSMDQIFDIFLRAFRTDLINQLVVFILIDLKPILSKIHQILWQELGVLQWNERNGLAMLLWWWYRYFVETLYSQTWRCHN